MRAFKRINVFDMQPALSFMALERLFHHLAEEKLYIRLGYVPDGRGISYIFQSTIPGESYPLMILWLKKDFYQSEKRK